MPRNQNISPFHPLSIIQANINKSALAYSLLLELGHTQQVDIILIQESWIMLDPDCCITKWHPAYNTHASTTNWTLKPRMMSYSLKSHSKLCMES